MQSRISDIIAKEAEQLPDNLLSEVLDFMLFLKNKKTNYARSSEETDLSSLQENELKHLEEEFADYKSLYPNE